MLKGKDMLRLETKKVMKWAQDEFGYYGHLTQLGLICGVKRNSVSMWNKSQYVPITHQATLIRYAKGKLKEVEVK